MVTGVLGYRSSLPCPTYSWRNPRGIPVFLVGLPGFLQELCLSHCPLNGCKFMRNSWRNPTGIPVKSCHSWYYSGNPPGFSLKKWHRQVKAFGFGMLYKMPTLSAVHGSIGPRRHVGISKNKWHGWAWWDLW